MTVPYAEGRKREQIAPHWRGLLKAGLLWGLAATAAHAVGVRQFSPQGDVSKVGQVVVQFDAPAVRFGDPKAAAPVNLQCSDAQAARGTGRWNSDKEWVFDFAQNLPAGVRCTAQLNPQFKSVSGGALTGAASYQVQTGGPQVARIAPDTYEEVDEQQYFALRLTGARPGAADSGGISAGLRCGYPARTADGGARDDCRPRLCRCQDLPSVCGAGAGGTFQGVGVGVVVGQSDAGEFQLSAV